jgi:hypothetical protein
MSGESGQSAFFHSFPRRALKLLNDRNYQQANALVEKSLRLFLDIGIVLAPELREIPKEFLKNGREEPILAFQKRFSLTLLDRWALQSHMQTFGPVSLEFRQSAIRALGGVPVIYIRNPRQIPIGAEDISVSTIHRLYELFQSLMALRPDIKEDLPDTGTEWSNGVLERLRVEDIDSYLATLQFLSALFVPASAPDEVGDNFRYFEQREWRLIGHIAWDKGAIDDELSSDEKERLAKIKIFSERPIALEGERVDWRRVDKSRVIRSFEGVPARDWITQIYALEPCYELVRSVAREYAIEDKVVGIER